MRSRHDPDQAMRQLRSHGDSSHSTTVRSSTLQGYVRGLTARKGFKLEVVDMPVSETMMDIENDVDLTREDGMADE